MPSRTAQKRGEIILDGFGGSGSTLMAAEKTGRSARLVEHDQIYCDTIVRRWQAYTGKSATLSSNSQKFDEVDEVRNGIVLESAEAAA